MAATTADRITEIDEQLASLQSKMQGILDAADKDNGGRLSAEQKTEYDGFDTSYDELLSEQVEIREGLDRADRLASRAEKAAEHSAAISKGTGRKTEAQSLEIETTDGRLRVTEKNLATYRLSSGEPVQRKKFVSLGQQLQTIAAVEKDNLQPGTHPDLVYDRFDKPSQGLAVATGGAAAGVPSDGGYLIQKDFAVDLFSRMSAEGSLPAVRTIQIGPNSDGLKMVVVDETSRATGSRWGGVRVYWAAEGDTATAKKPKTRPMELELKDLIGLAYATNRLLQDASALESIFLQAFAEEMAWEKEDAIINGTGAGQPKGITSTTGGSATVEVAKETGQAAATVVYENILNMYSRLWARSRSNAVWLINQDVEPSLNKMTLAMGTGGVPVYLPPGGASSSPYASLMGRPVIPVEYCQTLGTAGDIILWDPTQYLMIEKGGMQADQSIYVRFTTNENTFRFITRCDGQPLWNSALTPANGTNTQSPQVTLAVRA